MQAVNVLVLGGYGAVGARIVVGLRERGHVALAAGRDPERADRLIDLADVDMYSRSLSDIDVVVNASGVEDPALVERAVGAGIAFVDITATSKYIALLEEIDPKAPLLLSVGLAPGLTNLLAAAAYDGVPGPVDLALLVGAADEHGVAATEWSLRLLGGHFLDPAGAGSIRNYTHATGFDLPRYGSRRLYRADFSDQHTMTRDLGAPVRTYFGLDSRLATTALAALTWVPGASRLPAGLRLPGSDRWLALARANDGSMWWADGRGQSQATGTIAALAVESLARLSPGIHHLNEVMTVADVPTSDEIRVHTPRL